MSRKMVRPIIEVVSHYKEKGPSVIEVFAKVFYMIINERGKKQEQIDGN